MLLVAGGEYTIVRGCLADFYEGYHLPNLTPMYSSFLPSEKHIHFLLSSKVQLRWFPTGNDNVWGQQRTLGFSGIGKTHFSECSFSKTIVARLRGHSLLQWWKWLQQRVEGRIQWVMVDNICQFLILRFCFLRQNLAEFEAVCLWDASSGTRRVTKVFTIL